MKKTAATAIQNQQPETRQAPTSSSNPREIQHPRRKFDNQYNNAQYLVHPEKTYTQSMLNLIFEDKAKKIAKVEAPVPQKSGKQGLTSAQRELKDTPKGSAQNPVSALKNDTKTKTSPQTQQKLRTGK